MTNHYKNILVAVDGSKEAEYAFRKSIDVAKRNVGSTLNIVDILDARLEKYDRSVIDDAEEKANELLKNYKEQATSEGLENVNAIIEFGAPKRAIPHEIADKVQADLIMCGASGLNAVERFLIGSVSQSIVRDAKCDVLVIRTPEQ